MSHDNPLVSILIPAYNESTRLRATVYKIVAYCNKVFPSDWEIIIAENGSTDETLQIAEEFARIMPRVKARHIARASKAAALRDGIIAARGKYLYQCDCDLSTPISELPRFIAMLETGMDIVIGSREARGAQVETTFKRRMIGRVFNALVRGFMPELDYTDTQCGFKLYNIRAAREIFARTKCDSLAIDVEILYLAYKLGYYTTELPVTWVHDADSRVHILRDSVRMFEDLRRIVKWHGRVLPRWKLQATD